MSDAPSVFRQACRCGCGGFEAVAEHGTLYFHWFTSDWYSSQSSMRSALADRARYLSGNRLLREAVLDRDDFVKFRDFLASVEYGDAGDRFESAAPLAQVVPMHLFEDLYAVWLEGRMGTRDVLRGRFHRMFEVELTEMDRDTIVSQMDKWLARESRHSIAQGESPHVTRLVDQAPDPDAPAPEGVQDADFVEDGSNVPAVQAADQPVDTMPDDESDGTCDGEVVYIRAEDCDPVGFIDDAGFDRPGYELSGECDPEAVYWDTACHMPYDADAPGDGELEFEMPEEDPIPDDPGLPDDLEDDDGHDLPEGGAAS